MGRPGAGVEPPLVMCAGATLRAGECVALVGPSGVGKSTLLRGLVRLNPIAATRYVAGSDDATTLAPRTLRRRVAYVSQVPMPLAGDALENCRLAMHFGGPVPADWEARARQRLADVGLEEAHWTKQVSELSVGQRMRVALARALVIEPTVLLLDEPLAPLDRAGRDGVIALLSRWASEGRGVIASLHDAGDVTRFATTVWELSDPATLRVVPVGRWQP